MLFHRFILFKHECCTLFKFKNHVHNFRVQTTQIYIQYMCLNNMNKYMTFVFKQYAQHWCSNNTSKWVTSMSISYKLMKNRLCMIVIVKSWLIKFVMMLLIFTMQFLCCFQPKKKKKKFDSCSWVKGAWSNEIEHSYWSRALNWSQSF
jgi:hypothetical protein